MRTQTGFVLGALLSLGTGTTAFAAAGNVAAPVQPVAAIEVIVVTAKRPAPMQPVAVDVAQPIAEFIVTARAAPKAEERMPPTMAIEIPKLELAVAEPPLIRL